MLAKVDCLCVEFKSKYIAQRANKRVPFHVKHIGHDLGLGDLYCNGKTHYKRFKDLIISQGGQTKEFHVEHYTSGLVISFNRNGIEWGLSLPT